MVNDMSQKEQNRRALPLFETEYQGEDIREAIPLRASPPKCKGCFEDHEDVECPFRLKVCLRCGERGHAIFACLKLITLDKDGLPILRISPPTANCGVQKNVRLNSPKGQKLQSNICRAQKPDDQEKADSQKIVYEKKKASESKRRRFIPDTTSFTNSKRMRAGKEITTADGFVLLDSKSEDEVDETLSTSTSALNNSIENTDKDLSRTESYRQNNNNSFIVNPLSLRIQNNNNNNSSKNNHNDNVQTGRDNTDKDGSVSSTAKIIPSGDRQQTSGQEPSPAGSPPELVMFDETKKRVQPTEKKVIETDEEVAQRGTSFSSRAASTPTGLLVAKADPNIFAELLRLKVRACGALVFDFRDNAIDALVIEKEAKRETLTELVDFMTNSKNVVTEQLIDDAVSMVSANIFRPLPRPAAISSGLIPSIHDPEDVEPALEPGWSHLELVYKFFSHCVMRDDITPEVLQRYIDRQFIHKFLDLFATDDPRERDCLKTILDNIYDKLVNSRTLIIEAIQCVFDRFIYEDDSANGILELLEILYSVIDGFASPLKDEQKTFLDKSMLPLHKPKGFMSYHPQLTSCMTQYIDKEAKLAESIIWGLLKLWPVTDARKELLFLGEIEEILQVTQPAEFKKVMEPLMQHLATCLQSPNIEISEQVLYMWNNEYVSKLINRNRQQLFPIIIPSLVKNTREHWNSTVHQLTLDVSNILSKFGNEDPALFETCSGKNIQNEEKKWDEINKEMGSRWQPMWFAEEAEWD